tara:strand:- start:71 stop:688 length:618 start_codon:yes stop_codon:yes gene_type:complete
MIKVQKITDQNTLYSNSSSSESNSNCNSNLNTQELLDKYKSHTKKETEKNILNHNTDKTHIDYNQKLTKALNQEINNQKNNNIKENSQEYTCSNKSSKENTGSNINSEGTISSNKTTDEDLSTNKNNNYRDKIKNNQYIDLEFDANKKYTTDNYLVISKYLKKNKNIIIDELYNKKIIKKKTLPFRILFHIYVNYLNNDLELIFL